MDYTLGHLLHQGEFSSVNVIKDNRTNLVYALKTVKNKPSSSSSPPPEKSAELRILSHNSSDWIVRLFNYFEDEASSKGACFVLEYLQGGSLSSLLKNNGGKMDESAARFYLGELLLGIGAVHDMGFAHRNLRPDNILLTGSGHVKLCGFGAASRIGKDGKVTSPIAVDSASYEAPEIMRTLGDETFNYGVECDFWSFGVIAHEIVTGFNPFKSSNSLRAFMKITSQKTKGSVKLAPGVTQTLKGLIMDLLLEQTDRIGYSDCISHAFFNDLIWDALLCDIPPLLPTVDETHTEGLGENLVFSYKEEDDDGAVPVDNVSSTNFKAVSPQPSFFQLSTIKEDTESVEKNPTKIFEHSVFERDQLRLNAEERERLKSELDFQTNQFAEERERLKSELDLQTNQFAEERERLKSELDFQTNQFADEREILKSELDFQTNQLMDKLSLIQDLQTQLQKTNLTLEVKNSQLKFASKENQRLKIELEGTATKLSLEKMARHSLEAKLRNANNAKNSTMPDHDYPKNQSDDAVSPLRDEINNLLDAVSEKDDRILELSIDLQVARHEAKVQKLENGCILRRDENNFNVFAEEHSQDIANIESSIKNLSSVLCKFDNDVREEIEEIIATSTAELGKIKQDIKETQLKNETAFEEVKQKRKTYAESLVQIQIEIERVFEERIPSESVKHP